VLTVKRVLLSFFFRITIAITTSKKHARKGRTTYHWKALNEGYNFDLDFISIGGL
jgi:hypothetical protein